MKIIRNGAEFELTKEELLEAYLEQEHIWDIDYVRYTFIDFGKYDLIPENKREDVIEKIARVMRTFMYRNDCDECAALECMRANNANLFN